MTTLARHLPVDDCRDAIREALRTNPVVIVAGDTGSGKTTQIPQICLDLDLPPGSLVGCTQPRRVAAVSVAERVAQERGTPVGGEVGWQHRFGQALSAQTRVKFMTDGILLAETRGDPLLRRYSVVMIDEAHERTLNIDFLLGYLRRLLPRRPDLRVVVSSATMDVGRFARFFEEAGGRIRKPVPVLEIPGRTFPVEVRYRADGADDADDDLAERVALGVEELWTEADGDILVFLPGERDIREAMEAVGRRRLPDTDVLPLMASLPPADQRRVFHPVPGRRRVVLSTNVAETSLTIPGIRMVVDSGLARINRYSPRSRIERLHVEPISQASAEQRKGRCGRLGPGICLRLYSEEDFRERPAYAEPELRRSSLGGVILSMADLRLGPVEDFPFLDPPGSGAIREGYRELQEFGALRPDGSLTDLGRDMVRFPVEPRLARILLAARGDDAIADDVLTLVAALATEDPRLRPLERRDEADTLHRRFRVRGDDDFDSLLRLWRWFGELPSRTAQRRECRDGLLSFRRFQEWGDVREQLTRTLRNLPERRRPPFPAPRTSSRTPDPRRENRLRALLSGLLSNIGQRDAEAGDYRGANGVRFAIHPGSALAKSGPDWVVAADLVDTSRLYARRVAGVDPAWIEAIAAPLCKYGWHSPFWDAQTGTARALERAVFRGLTLYDGRRRDYSRIDPAASRELFVRHGLVLGELPQPVPDLARRNLALFESIRDDHRKRREPEDTDDESFVALYLERLPAECVNVAALRRWLRHAPPEAIAPLSFRREDFSVGEETDPSAFPPGIRLDGHWLRLDYRSDEGAEDDGITCSLSPEAIPSLRRWAFDWLVPGALRGKLAWMLSRLTRTQTRPLPSRETLLDELPSLLGPPTRPLDQALAALLRKRWGVVVPDGVWDPATMPPHLRVRFRVLDSDHREAFATRDPDELRTFHDEYIRALSESSGRQRTPRAASPPSPAPPAASGDPLWPWGPLPESAEVGYRGWKLENFPALVDEDGTVALRWFADRAEATAAHRGGLRRLCEKALGRDFDRLAVTSSATRSDALAAAAAGHDLAALRKDCALAAIDEILLPVDEPLPRAPGDFRERLAKRRGALGQRAAEHLRLALGALSLSVGRRADIDRLDGEGRLPDISSADLREQLDWLFFPGFARMLPTERLRRYGCYLEALRLRLERAARDPRRDAERTRLVRVLWDRYTEQVERPGLTPEQHRVLADIRWAIEEYRVSLHAQELRTPEPVSAQRIERLFGKL